LKYFSGYLDTVDTRCIIEFAHFAIKAENRMNMNERSIVYNTLETIIPLLQSAMIDPVERGDHDRAYSASRDCILCIIKSDYYASLIILQYDKGMKDDASDSDRLFSILLFPVLSNNEMSPEFRIMLYNLVINSTKEYMIYESFNLICQRSFSMISTDYENTKYHQKSKQLVERMSQLLLSSNLILRRMLLEYISYTSIFYDAQSLFCNYILDNILVLARNESDSVCLQHVYSILSLSYWLSEETIDLCCDILEYRIVESLSTNIDFHHLDSCIFTLVSNNDLVFNRCLIKLFEVTVDSMANTSTEDKGKIMSISRGINILWSIGKDNKIRNEILPATIGPKIRYLFDQMKNCDSVLLDSLLTLLCGGQILEQILLVHESLDSLIVQIIEYTSIPTDTDEQNRVSLNAYLCLFRNYGNKLSTEAKRCIVTKFNWSEIVERGVCHCSANNALCLLSELKMLGLNDTCRLFWMILPIISRNSLRQAMYRSASIEIHYKVLLALLQMIIEDKKNSMRNMRWNSRNRRIIIGALENNMSILARRDVDLQVLHSLLDIVKNLPIIE
jgi:hypothetical protein